MKYLVPFLLVAASGICTPKSFFENKIKRANQEVVAQQMISINDTIKNNTILAIHKDDCITINP